MNKADRKRLEQRIRSLNDPPCEPGEEHLEEIRQKAAEAYERMQQSPGQNGASRGKARSILLRAGIVAALAVFLLAFPLLYTALMPATSAKADLFFRRSALWLNKQLRLGIVFSVPINDEADVEFPETEAIASLEDLERVTQIPFLYFPETEELPIKTITCAPRSGGSKTTSILYMNDADSILIVVEPLMGNGTIGLAPASREVELTMGTLYIYATDSGSYAMCVLDQCIETVMTTYSPEWLEENCVRLQRFN